MSILERVQDDVKTAMKAGERDRVGALRMIVHALQQEAKEGKDDEVAALQRERKRRIDAAESLREGGRDDQAAAEESEAELIEGYLPQQLSDEELGEIVAAASYHQPRPPWASTTGSSGKSRSTPSRSIGSA